MRPEPAAAAVDARPNRHTVAKWAAPNSLRGRLLLFVALISGVVVGGVSYLEVRSFTATTERELADTAQRTARAVADDLENRTPPLDALDVRDTLHEFAEADAVIRSISVVARGDSGQPEVFASTSSEERSDTVALAGRAIEADRSTDDRNQALTTFAVPLRRPAGFAVVVAVSRSGVQQTRSRGRTIALAFALPTILLVTLLVGVTARQLVHRPIAEIHGTMERAARGELQARATVLRRDELGLVAERLNDMLDRLEHFNEVLRDRVRDATERLRERNAQLADTYNQMLTLRESLARTERMAALGHMAATVAHQVGTPLNLVSGYVQMLRDDPGTSAMVRQRLHTVDVQIQQVTHVLRAMLDQARQPPRRELTQIAHIIERVRELVGPRLTRLGVTADITVADHLPPVSADPVQLEMALLNLVANALDAMPQGGILILRATAQGEMVRIEVEDTGAGIPVHLLDHIFEPWMTTKPPGHGTGIGLGIVRDVIRSHDGTVSAGNASSGGARFRIELPRHRGAA